jgi:hypothetical protein
MGTGIMRYFIIIFLLPAFCLSLSTAFAQTDPYAKEMARAMEEHYKKEWNEFSTQAQMNERACWSKLLSTQKDSDRCRELGWFAVFAPPSGWVPCAPGDEGAQPDLNRLYSQCRWDQQAQRWVPR